MWREMFSHKFEHFIVWRRAAEGSGWRQVRLVMWLPQTKDLQSHTHTGICSGGFLVVPTGVLSLYRQSRCWKGQTDLKATLSSSHPLTCITQKSPQCRQCSRKPFFGSMVRTFVRAPSLNASVWCAALCRLIYKCFHMNVAAQPWMGLYCLCTHVFKLTH